MRKMISFFRYQVEEVLLVTWLGIQWVSRQSWTWPAWDTVVAAAFLVLFWAAFVRGGIAP